MNLSAQPQGGVAGEAGGVCIGVQGAPPATFSSFPQSMADTGLTVGQIEFSSNAEDRMAESIVRINRELEEAQAQIAVYEVERSILQREREELRQKNKMLAQCWRDAEQERDQFRMRLEASK